MFERNFLRERPQVKQKTKVLNEASKIRKYIRMIFEFVVAKEIINCNTQLVFKCSSIVLRQ